VREFQVAGARVFLVTDDTGARTKARFLGVQALVLSDELRLLVELDPLERENAWLEQIAALSH